MDLPFLFEQRQQFHSKLPVSILILMDLPFLSYIKELIDLLVYFKANYDIINSLINFIEISENSKTYLRTTMLDFKDLNDSIEKEIKSERKQFLGDKHKRNYNRNIKFIIKNWNMS